MDVKHRKASYEPVSVFIGDFMVGTIIDISDKKERTMSEDNIVILDDFPATEVLKITPQHNMVFSNESGEVGKIAWDDGVMVFTGNADEFAETMFRYLKGYIDNYINYEVWRRLDE